MATILLPGSEISPDLLPKPNKKGHLTLGPNLRFLPPSTVLSTTAGSLHIDSKKSALWLEHPHGRYMPSIGDLVIAQIHRSAGELYYCSLTPHTAHATLGHLAFEGANKKSRPQLKSGDVVYARVCKAGRGEEVEVECVNSNTGKAEGMGGLSGGMVFEVSPGFARRLMMGTDRKSGSSLGGVVVLEEVGEKVRFEVAVGRNGRVWVDSGSVRETVGIGRCLRECDEQGLGVEEQRKLVKRVLREL